MSKSKLKKQIQKKLEQLNKLLDKVDEVRNIEVDNYETWDSDMLYNTVEVLKEVLQILED